MIKFTPDKGSINVELSVIERQNSSDASIAEISITDTGIGISAEFLPHVFDRFRQAQESSSSKALGLGLAIARHFVELHNGTIRAKSAGEGQGRHKSDLTQTNFVGASLVGALDQGRAGTRVTSHTQIL